MTPKTANFRIPPLFVSPEISGIGGGGGGGAVVPLSVAVQNFYAKVA